MTRELTALLEWAYTQQAELAKRTVDILLSDAAGPLEVRASTAIKMAGMSQMAGEVASKIKDLLEVDEDEGKT